MSQNKNCIKTHKTVFSEEEPTRENYAFIISYLCLFEFIKSNKQQFVYE